MQRHLRAALEGGGPDILDLPLLFVVMQYVAESLRTGTCLLKKLGGIRNGYAA